MNLHVKHLLTYEYDKPVALDPHLLYLYPKSYPHQRVLDYSLIINPLPSKVVRNVDAEGNVQQVAYFADTTQRLSVEANMTLRSDAFNVFDFVLYPFEAKNIPFRYSERQSRYLAPYLGRQELTPYLEQFARQIAASVQWATVPFMTELSRYINQTFSYQQRTEGRAFPPDETLRALSGSCRDFSSLFITVCRSLGIAARFVSGYLYGNPTQAHELHAWVEVYLPGAGWRGFDPTEGRAMINNHICLAASADYDQLAPVMGSFRGSASSFLTTYVEIEEVDGIS
ncbi:transglutaminase family protein [Arundinibacter roseus]|uniref:Transglutaminase family protein n=1 Tax=Arundinibacter roseus TaxID=2070510 RepID=A0A4R4KB00_9BACT|nr:transglutaminase family protein [Arundinibacter roseus]TDB63329.1 transglutaminase family protein [Arundinibacter roseus]